MQNTYLEVQTHKILLILGTEREYYITHAIILFALDISLNKIKILASILLLVCTDIFLNLSVGSILIDKI